MAINKDSHGHEHETPASPNEKARPLRSLVLGKLREVRQEPPGSMI
jgi:hypothetical protein